MVFEYLKKNWVVLVFIVSLIMWYTTTNSRLDGLEAKADEQSVLIEKVNQLLTETAVIKSVQIQQSKDIEFIKSRLQ